MQTCKILIADDEKLAREAIKLQLADNENVQIIAECADGAEALQHIQEHLPSIIFLDIQMPSLTGFEVLQALPSEYQPSLIIVTAHDNYAVRAYEHDAVDYLVKPFTEERFNKAFQKAYKQWELNAAQQNTNSTASFTERVINVLEQSNTYRSRIVVKDGIKLFVVPCDDIIFIEAKGDYTAIQTADKKYLHNESLAKLEESLEPSAFRRIHRSSIVNIHFIKELSSHYNGDYTVILNNGHTLKLSRNYRKQLLEKIG
jgi:two-component system LytT family response regulator